MSASGLSIVVGPLLVALVAALWIAVQRAWLRAFRAFPGVAGEPDALAARRHGRSCGGCKSHDDSCERRSHCEPARKE
jgi:hypothetical protein